jgi:positive regulator of sigma E activity
MTMARPEGELQLKSELFFYNDHVNLQKTTMSTFDKLVRRHLLIHIFFYTLLISECILLFFFLSMLLSSSVVSIALSGIFLSIFAYIILRLYLQTQKISRLHFLMHKFMSESAAVISYQQGSAEYHVAMQQTCGNF